MEDLISEEKNAEFSAFEAVFEEGEASGIDEKIKKKLTKEKIKEQIDKFSEKAKKIIDNPEKVSAVLEKAMDLCEDLSHVRFVGKYFKDTDLHPPHPV